MSGPYDQYYNQQQGYNQYPAPGYGAPQQPHYGGGYPDQGFAPPARTNSYGPPQQGGFQHGTQGHQYGAYDASNPQGHSGYYGQPQQQQSYDAYSQNQAYQQYGQQQQYGQPSGPGAYADPQGPPQTSPQSSDPNAPNYDPNAPPMTESDRGLLGAAGGAWAGHKFGKKEGHGFLGTIGGAIMGSLTEDFAKDKYKKNKHGHHNHHNSGSSWGGSRY